MRLRFLLLFILGISTFWAPRAHSQDGCDPCEPLAQVAITQQGLGRLYDLVLRNYFSQLSNQVGSRAQFRELNFACPNTTLGSDKKCIPFPDFSKIDPVDGRLDELKLRPYAGRVKNIKLERLGMKIIDPVECKDFHCSFSIGVSDLAVSGQAALKFTDNHEVALPPSEVRVESTTSEDLKYKFKVDVLIDPNTGEINKLMRVQPKSTELGIPASSLRVSINGKGPALSNEKSVRDQYEEQYRLYREKFKDKKWIQAQLRVYESQTFFSEHLSKADYLLKSEGYSTYCTSEPKGRLEKCIEREQQIRTQLSKDNEQRRRDFLKEASVEKLQNIKWPEYSGEGSKIFENLPEVTRFIPVTAEQVEMANGAILARQQGFPNVGSFAQVKAAEAGVNHLLAHQGVIDSYINPWLEKEFDPAFKEQVDRELANLQQHWTQISKVPNLDFGLLERQHRAQTEIERLSAAIESVESSAEQNSLKENLEKNTAELARVRRQIADAWTPIDTRVAIDASHRASGVLSGSIHELSENCRATTAFMPNDINYDLATQLGVKAVDKYLEVMVKQGRFSFCNGSDSPDCIRGERVIINEKPEVRCENGKYLLRFKNAKLTNLRLRAEKELRVSLENCSGSPCFHLEGGKGRFNFFPLNMVVGSALNHTLDNIFTTASKSPLTIPQVEMQSSVTDKNTCQTQIFWKLPPPNNGRNR